MILFFIVSGLNKIIERCLKYFTVEEMEINVLFIRLAGIHSDIVVCYYPARRPARRPDGDERVFF